MINKKITKYFLICLSLTLLAGFGTVSAVTVKIKNGASTSGVSSVSLNTNQTQCYNNSSVLTACSNTVGEDANYQKGQARSYTDNSDGTIIDNSTGLMWHKCPYGLSGASCSSGTASLFTWSNAISACESDATLGYADWRLPNINEMESLADYNVSRPTTNSTYFPNVSATAIFWTSTTYYLPQNAYSFSFDAGLVFQNSKISSRSFRCVR